MFSRLLSPSARPSCSACSGRSIVCVLHDEPECLLCKEQEDTSTRFNWKPCGACNGEGEEPYRHLALTRCATYCGLRAPLAGAPAAVPIVVVSERPTCPRCVELYAQSSLALSEKRVTADLASIWRFAEQTAVICLSEPGALKR